ncbi:MAG: hypothetical protein WDK95_10655, partial [Syntrophorhabdaceae bacterium]
MSEKRFKLGDEVKVVSLNMDLYNHIIEKPKPRNYVSTAYPVDIVPLYPNGTNSTMFTQCCEVAICDCEPNCPCCGMSVIGHDAKTEG